MSNLRIEIGEDRYSQLDKIEQILHDTMKQNLTEWNSQYERSILQAQKNIELNNDLVGLYRKYKIDNLE